MENLKFRIGISASKSDFRLLEIESAVIKVAIN